MAVSFACDNCGVTSPNTIGWFMVSVSLVHDDPTAPNPPGGRMLDQTLPDFVFHVVTCRDAWLARAGIVVPPSATPA